MIPGYNVPAYGNIHGLYIHEYLFVGYNQVRSNIPSYFLYFNDRKS
jgi:hypothetical protein